LLYREERSGQDLKAMRCILFHSPQLSASVSQTFPVPLLGAECGNLSNSGEEYCRKHHRPAKSLGGVDYVPAQRKSGLDYCWLFQ